MGNGARKGQKGEPVSSHVKPLLCHLFRHATAGTMKEGTVLALFATVVPTPSIIAGKWQELHVHLSS